MANLNSGHWVDLKELSTILGLSESGVRYHIRKGRIKFVPLGRKKLFNLDDLWAKGNKPTTASTHPDLQISYTSVERLVIRDSLKRK